MSLPLRAQAPNLRENKENKPKLATKAGNRRAVLVNVNSNVRKQPLRAAKDKHAAIPTKTFSGQENEPPQGKKITSGSSFAIFEDIKAEAAPREVSVLGQRNVAPDQDLVLREVVGLKPSQSRRVSHAPLRPIVIDAVEDSPMVVDQHVVEQRYFQPEYGLECYSEDIYKYLTSVEGASRPAKNYMNRQTDVSTSMRNILVDWLVEVGEEYKLHRETLFLSICYIDKFLSLVGVQRPKLQLLGAASMFIAAKYEEIYPPEVGEFVYITDDTYTKRQVLKMESVILKLLEFRVSVPTINWFLERFLHTMDMNENGKCLAFFLAELSLIEVEDFLEYPPSVVAASCILLSRSTLEQTPNWPASAEQFSGYSVRKLTDCVTTLYKLYSKKSSMAQQAVIEKYKQEKYKKVALLVAPPVLTFD